jgi:diguanylate cyclase (GGDEF)-like protein/PAS domain S-box-containing protein
MLFNQRISQAWSLVRNKVGKLERLIGTDAELKKTETALQFSAQWLKLALASGQVGIWEYKLQTNELIWDDNMFALYGARREDFSGAYDAWSTRLHPEDRAATETALQDAIAGIREYEPEFRIIWTSGEVRYIKGHAQVIKDQDGKPVRMIGTNWDNSVNASTQQQLKLAHTAIDKCKSAFYWISSEGQVIDVNDSACQSLGYTREELVGKNVWEFDPDFPAEAWPPMWEGLKVTRVVNIETRHQRKDGTIFPVEVVGNIISSAGKEFSFVFVQDITDRKQADEKINLLMHEQSAILESELLGIAKSKNRIISWNNPTYEKLLGYGKGELLGKTTQLLFPSQKAYEALGDAAYPVIQSGGLFRSEVQFVRKDGSLIWADISGVMLDASLGESLWTFADITQRKTAAEEIEQLAFYDSLTQLPNRRLLLDRIKQALATSARSGMNGALLFIDLDHFKTLNDTLGHNMGDLLLQQVAQRLTSCVREGDTVARLGGDEFVVMLEDLSLLPIEAASMTEVIGEKIKDVLNQPFQLAAHHYSITPSLGATLFTGHELEVETLMQESDIAMYQAKKAGRNTLCFFDTQMQETINLRVSFEGDLRKALENKEFRLYYQIQRDSSQRTLGAEALIRWLHPQRGLVSPDEFIALAEETGLILPIGQWVLETACAQLKAWKKGSHTRDLVMAVNVSAKQFRQANFVDQVQLAISQNGINPELLKLELTESLLLENVEEVIATMNALKAIGLQFSLDDFGTGYSSLQYLRRLPMDQIKIDQSFIRDLATSSNALAIVRTIIAMAQSLNLNIIAEGVEKEEQRQLLLANGCLNYQGYLFGKPVPIKEFEALLA